MANARLSCFDFVPFWTSVPIRLHVGGPSTDSVCPATLNWLPLPGSF